MKWRTLVGAVALVAVTVLITSEVVSQDRDTSEAAKGEKSGKADSESLVETWVKHAMPGAKHKVLERMAGTWSLKVEYRMDSGGEVVESEGTCTRKWILGGRFLLEEFDGGSLALPFQGLAIYGYDSFEQKFTSAWVDTMNTAITTSLGTCAGSCDVIRFVGRHGDPWTGVKKNTRGVTRFVNDNQHVLELYEPGSDGKEFKILQITYSRVKRAGGT